MTASPDRATYRDVLAQVVEQAKMLLPEQVNGRIESATKLVLSGDVFFRDDGSIEVGGSDPTRYYRLIGSGCTCTDYAQEKAPQGWCKHRIAANLLKSVERVMARRGAPEPAPEVILPAEMDVSPDNDPEPEETPMPSPQPAPVPCPEALFSLTLKGHIDGHEALLTARGQTAAEFQANLAAVRGLLDQPTPTPLPSQPPAVPEPEPRFCPRHGDKMRLNHKDGRQWHSHRLATGEYCKGK